MYHRLVHSTRMLMRIGLQEQVEYLRDGQGRISNPVGSSVLLWNHLRIVTIRKPLVSYMTLVAFLVRKYQKIRRDSRVPFEDPQ